MEALEYLGFAFAGWRFVFSSRFRETTRVRWAHETQLQRMQEIVGAVGGVIVSITLPVLVWWSLRIG